MTTRPSECDGVTCRTCNKQLKGIGETWDYIRHNGNCFTFTPPGEEWYYRRNGQNYYSCHTCFVEFEGQQPQRTCGRQQKDIGETQAFIHQDGNCYTFTPPRGEPYYHRDGTNNHLCQTCFEEIERQQPRGSNRPSECYGVTCRTCHKQLQGIGETHDYIRYNGYCFTFTPPGGERYYRRNGQNYYSCHTCFEDSERDSRQKALQRGLQGGKKTVCRSRLVLVGQFGAGKTSLKRSLLGEEFIDEHIETDSIEADPSKAKVDITNTRGWQIHKVEQEYREVFTAYIVQQVMESVDQEATDPDRTDVKMENLQDATKIEEDAERRLQADVDRLVVELFIWDFGGQSVYYNTHMTFLTRQSIYVVIMDMTKALTDKIPTWCLNQMGERIIDTSCPQTVADYLDYWCACIHTFVPPETKPDVTHGQVATPAIVIVGTHRDECTTAEAQQFEKQVKAYIATKPYANQINQDIFTISNKNRDENEIKKLQDKIVSLATMQSYELPISWVKFKEKISDEAGDAQRISFRKAKMIGSQIGLDESDVVSALGFFHEVGDVVYFNEKTVSGVIITEPQWLIEQFRKVITIPAYHERFFADSDKHWSNLYRCGVLHEAVLKNVWSEDVKDELIALMKKFALLCEITSKQLATLGLDYKEIATDDVDHRLYLVPSLIGSADRVLSEENSVLPVFLTPTADFIPIGLMSRLIAGLMNEDEWQLVHVSKDAAIFLPNGDYSDVDVCITAMKDKIEISGNKVDEETRDYNFSGCLDIVCNRLNAITSSVCPQQSFTVSIQCLVCKKNRKEVLQKVEQFSKSFYCGSHRKRWNTSEYSHWFHRQSAEASCSLVTGDDRIQSSLEEELLQAKVKDLHLQNPLALVDAPQTACDLRNVPLPDALRAVLNSNRVELVKCIDPDRVFDYLRQWNTLTADEEEKIMLNHTRAEKVQHLLDLIGRRSQQDYVNFKQALIDSEQVHIAKILNESENKARLH